MPLPAPQHLTPHQDPALRTHTSSKDSWTHTQPSPLQNCSFTNQSLGRWPGGVVAPGEHCAAPGGSKAWPRVWRRPSSSARPRGAPTRACSEQTGKLGQTLACTSRDSSCIPLQVTRTTAGGLQVGHPPLPKEWAAVVSELKKRPRPRSPSFTTPVAVMNTLAGLMSAGEGRGLLWVHKTRSTREGR